MSMILIVVNTETGRGEYPGRMLRMSTTALCIQNYMRAHITYLYL